MTTEGIDFDEKLLSQAFIYYVESRLSTVGDDECQTMLVALFRMLRSSSADQD